jgi:hypothetical protein
MIVPDLLVLMKSTVTRRTLFARWFFGCRALFVFSLPHLPSLNLVMREL